MKIVRREPGRLFELAETDPRMPLLFAIGALTLIVLVAAPWKGLWQIVVHGRGRETLDLTGSAVWFAAGLLILAGLVGGYRLERVSADRDAGRLTWRWSHLMGLFRWGGHVRLETLDGFSLAAVPKPGMTYSSGSEVPLRLTLHRRNRGQGRSIDFLIDQVSSASAISEVALRLGAAAGFGFYRVVLNLPPRFEIELRTDAVPGFSAVPLEGAGDPRDAVSVAAAAATAKHRLPAFDPATFLGPARVTVWRPGQEVRFEKPVGAALLLAPLMFAVLLGPLAYLRLPSLHEAPLPPRVAALTLITLVGFAIALAGGIGFTTGLPRRVLLDWATRRLSVASPFKRIDVSLDQIGAVELLNRVSHHGSMTGRNGNMPYDLYHTEVRALLHSALPKREALLLLETRIYKDDPETSRFMALPLANELAAALRVERRETTEYPTPEAFR